MMQEDDNNINNKYSRFQVGVNAQRSETDFELNPQHSDLLLPPR